MRRSEGSVQPPLTFTDAHFVLGDGVAVERRADDTAQPPVAGAVQPVDAPAALVALTGAHEATAADAQHDAAGAALGFLALGLVAGQADERPRPRLAQQKRQQQQPPRRRQVPAAATSAAVSARPPPPRRDRCQVHPGRRRPARAGGSRAGAPERAAKSRRAAAPSRRPRLRPPEESFLSRRRPLQPNFCSGRRRRLRPLSPAGSGARRSVRSSPAGCRPRPRQRSGNRARAAASPWVRRCLCPARSPSPDSPPACGSPRSECVLRPSPIGRWSLSPRPTRRLAPPHWLPPRPAPPAPPAAPDAGAGERRSKGEERPGPHGGGGRPLPFAPPLPRLELRARSWSRRVRQNPGASRRRPEGSARFRGTRGTVGAGPAVGAATVGEPRRGLGAARASSSSSARAPRERGAGTGSASFPARPLRCGGRAPPNPSRPRSPARSSNFPYGRSSRLGPRPGKQAGSVRCAARALRRARGEGRRRPLRELRLRRRCRLGPGGGSGARRCPMRRFGSEGPAGGSAPSAVLPCGPGQRSVPRGCRTSGGTYGRTARLQRALELPSPRAGSQQRLRRKVICSASILFAWVPRRLWD